MEIGANRGDRPWGSVIEKGKEKMISWVRGKKVVVTPNTFAEIFDIPHVENPDFAFPDVRMQNCLSFLESYFWWMTIGMTVAMSVTRMSLLWAIGTGKSIDLPRIMFMAFCSAYDSSDIRGSVPFIRFLMALFKKYDISIPVDLIRTKQEKPIDKYSLTRSKGQRKKRKLVASSSEAPIVGIDELQDVITNLRIKFDTRNDWT
ncbi:hypothetical protein Acr_12g0001170 [Actinidia rufa]|uniref:Uncharacterized protein n=1 Tax=Actinidia rufa TaxID=165716 RepID=A0A7J0FGL9_9ERIC|nr:hypothetical protein Acr_12g0001170 [Actinidia rufa]